MALNALHLLLLMPRRSVMRLAVAALVALLFVGSTPAGAKQDSRVKRVKKELVRVELMHDERLQQLDRLGARWDELEGRKSSGGGLASLVEAALGSVEQAHLEMSMVETRVAVDALEEKRDRTIAALQRIVLERQQKKMAGAGLAPALMPSINVGGSLVTYSADWEKTAMCESTKRWNIDSRYDGGLQFDPITWIEFGGAEFARYAYEATKMEQIAVAERVLAIQGPKAWPLCFTPLPADGDG